MMKKMVNDLVKIYNDLQLEIAEDERMVEQGAEYESSLEMEYEILEDLQRLIEKTEYFELEFQIGRRLTNEEKVEVEKLISMDYKMEDCIAMIYQQQTAEEYDYGIE